MEKMKKDRKFEKAKITILELLEEGYMGYQHEIFMEYVRDNRLVTDTVQWLLEYKHIRQLPGYSRDTFVITEKGLHKLEALRRDQMYKHQTNIVENQLYFNKLLFMATGIIALTTVYNFLSQFVDRTEAGPGRLLFIGITTVVGIGALLLSMTFLIHLLNHACRWAFGKNCIGTREKKKW